MYSDITDDTVITVHASYVHHTDAADRNPRREMRTTDIPVRLKTFDLSDAPLAMEYLAEVDGQMRRIPIRAAGGTLYRPESPGDRPSVDAPVVGLNFPTEQTLLTRDGLDRAMSRALAAFQDLAVIDGGVWRSTPEPRYAVSRSGSLQISFTNPSTSTLFRADQVKPALEHAAGQAELHGNAPLARDYGRHPERYTLIVVHIPEQVRLVIPDQDPDTVQDLRRRLASAVREHSRAVRPEQEAHAWSAMCALREEILDQGGVPLPPGTPPYEDR